MEWKEESLSRSSAILCNSLWHPKQLADGGDVAGGDVKNWYKIYLNELKASYNLHCTSMIEIKKPRN